LLAWISIGKDAVPPLEAGGTFVEAFSPARDPIFWNIITNRPKLVDGMFTLPDGPGLGWELDQDFIEGHRVDR
jgi:D-galactarolactone cycloisomerase